MGPIPVAETMPPLLLAVWVSFLAGSATLGGAAGVLLFRRFSAVAEDMLLSLAAGVMLAASFFSLLIPGIEEATKRLGSATAGFALVTVGLVAGAALIWAIHERLPHEHLHLGRDGPAAERLQRVWLFVFTMALHNLPEGMAVGVAMMQESTGPGLVLALGIGLQNIPEGLATAVALRAIGFSPWVAVAVGGATGWIEPVGSLMAASLVAVSGSLLGFFLGVAAGAMLYVILDEIIPEVHRRGTSHHVTVAMFGGFIVMMALDVLLAT